MQLLRLATACSFAIFSVAISAQTIVPLPPTAGFAAPAYHARPAAAPGQPRGLDPKTVRHFYGFESIAGTGTGQTIAIVDAYDDPNIESDLAVFTSQFGLPPCTTANGCFSKAYASGIRPAANASWAIEIALDVQWAHAIAPGAKILLVEAADNYFSSLLSAVNYAVSHGAGVVSMSFGGSEFSQEMLYDSTFQATQASFVASSGDSGAGVQYPAASPYVLAVGGTSAQTNMAGAHYGESAWSYSGGGQSLYESQPFAQANFGIRAGVPYRTVPDVAYMGDPVQGVSVYNTFTAGTTPGWFQIGGTSAGAPQWAAILAIINGERVRVGKRRLSESYAYGTLDAIYSLARSSYSESFNDIQSGANGYCGKPCIADVGYDVVTGLGTPKIKTLIPALIAAP